MAYLETTTDQRVNIIFRLIMQNYINRIKFETTQPKLSNECHHF